MINLKCLMCLGEMVVAESKNALGDTVSVTEAEDAVTLAPSWQEKRVGPQLVMACVTVPVCKKHLQVEQLSPAEQAIRNGKILPGTMVPNG